METDVKKVFNFICGSGGVLQFTDLISTPSPLTRLSAADAKRKLEEIARIHSCFILLRDSDKIFNVRIYFKTRLCVQYLQEVECPRGSKCNYWHICKGYMEGNCRKKDCQLSHDFKDDQNLTILEALELSQHPNNTIRNILSRCLPRVCKEYAKGCCTVRENCANLHICSKLVENLCPVDRVKCFFSHNVKSPPNVSVLRRAELAPRLPDTILFSHILLPEQLSFKSPFALRNHLPVNEKSENVEEQEAANTSKIKENLPYKQVSSKAKWALTPITVNKSDQNNTLRVDHEKQGSRVPPSCLSSQRSSHSDSKVQQILLSTPSEKAVFNCLVKEYNCIAKFSVITSRKDLFPSAFTEQASWFRARPNSFVVSENDRGGIEEVSAFSRRARLCFDSGRCQKQECPYFHTCRSQVAGECRTGATCRMSHDLDDLRDRRNAIRCNLNSFTDDQLRHLLRASSPQVCGDYNEGECTRAGRCSRIHICKSFVRKHCSNCELDHKEAFKTDHTQKLLTRYNLDKVPQSVLLKSLLICEDKQDGKPIDVNVAGEHIYEDSKEHNLCSDFILGKYHKASECDMHHFHLPYLWQCVELPGNSEWKCFTEEENEEIEKSYCDVYTGSCTKRVDLTSILPCFFPEDKVVQLDFQDMTMKHKDLITPLRIRRLSTRSHINDDGVMATKWVWYWNDTPSCGHKLWYPYGGEDVGKTQKKIEESFIDMAGGCSVSIEGKTYKLMFSDDGNGEMFQEKTGSGHKSRRAVRRRPQFRSKDDIQGLVKESQKTSKMENKRGKAKLVPLSWEEVPPECDYKRIVLLPSSDEFRKVKGRFRQTIGREKATIVSIERVQNSFMWEKYTRKKEQMKLKLLPEESIGERTLFHGTSDDVIDSICKQNFDWRINGKNATFFGQGSYFARDAAYSHRFTSENSNSSRFMLLAKVLVGSYTKGESHMRRPPSKSNSDPTDLYDSCVNDVTHPSTFVVFDKDQYYPSHVIEYYAHSLVERTSITAAHSISTNVSSTSALSGNPDISNPYRWVSVSGGASRPYKIPTPVSLLPLAKDERNSQKTASSYMGRQSFTSGNTSSNGMVTSTKQSTTNSKQSVASSFYDITSSRYGASTNGNHDITSSRYGASTNGNHDITSSRYGASTNGNHDVTSSSCGVISAKQSVTRNNSGVTSAIQSVANNSYGITSANQSVNNNINGVIASSSHYATIAKQSAISGSYGVTSDNKGVTSNSYGATKANQCVPSVTNGNQGITRVSQSFISNGYCISNTKQQSVTSNSYGVTRAATANKSVTSGKHGVTRSSVTKQGVASGSYGVTNGNQGITRVNQSFTSNGYGVTNTKQQSVTSNSYGVTRGTHSVTSVNQRATTTKKSVTGGKHDSTRSSVTKQGVASVGVTRRNYSVTTSNYGVTSGRHGVNINRKSDDNAGSFRVTSGSKNQASRSYWLASSDEDYNRSVSVCPKDRSVARTSYPHVCCNNKHTYSTLEKSKKKSKSWKCSIM